MHAWEADFRVFGPRFTPPHLYINAYSDTFRFCAETFSTGHLSPKTRLLDCAPPAFEPGALRKLEQVCHNPHFGPEISLGSRMGEPNRKKSTFSTLKIPQLYSPPPDKNTPNPTEQMGGKSWVGTPQNRRFFDNFDQIGGGRGGNA
jgi:hypothetical protein